MPHHISYADPWRMWTCGDIPKEQMADWLRDLIPKDESNELSPDA